MSMAVPTDCRQDVRPGLLDVSVKIDPGADRALSWINERFMAVAQFGAVGGFSGAHIDPRESMMTLRARSEGADGYVTWHFVDVNADPAVLGVIQNIVDRASLDSSGVVGLFLASSLCRHRGRVPFPKFSYAVPLPFHFEDLSEGRRVVVGVEFQDDQPEERRQVFVRTWEHWIALTEGGAWSDEDVAVDVSGAIVPETPRSIPSGLLFVHERARLSPAGFVCLVNAFNSLHRRVAAVEEIVIS